MSKRFGNSYTVRDLVAPESEGGRGVDPLALRLALIAGQYRKPYNFTFATVRDSTKHVQRFRETLARVDEIIAADAPGPDRIGERLDAIYTRTLEAMLDDLNTPAALAAALDGVKLINGMSAHLNGASARRAQAWFDQINALLGIVYHEAAPTTTSEEADPLA